MFLNEKKKIKIFGERNTGKSYLESVLKLNYDVEILDFEHYGPRHGFAPAKEKLNDKKSEETIFIFLVKNPYSWLLSMHKNPLGHQNLSEVSFAKFIRSKFGDSKNPMLLWNEKNRSYKNAEQYIKNYFLVKYENLINNAESELNKISLIFSLKKSEKHFQNITNHVSHNHGILDIPFHTDYYKREQWKKLLKPEDIEVINSNLDMEFLQGIGYELLQNI